MNKLRGIRLRIIVLAAYAFMMMVMGFLHQPVAGVGVGASRIQIADAASATAYRHDAASGNNARAALDHVAMGHGQTPDEPGNGGDPHKNHNRVICDACLANAGHAALPSAPELEKLVALKKSAHAILAALVLEEAYTLIAQPRAPPASLIA